MKRVAAMTLALIMLLAVMAQAAGPAKVPQARTSLTFSGTTANCSVNIRANNSNDAISATVKLWKGNTCLYTWNENGTGRISFQKTAPVSRGAAYKLTVDFTCAGVKQPQQSVTRTCS